jgi:hypothetical protein
MVRLGAVVMAALVGPLMLMQGSAPVRVADGPTYTAEGQLRYPERYRGWVFLTSGFNMSYNAKAKDDGDGMFDNVFVNPEAYQVYQATGHWPEGTELVLENRGAEVGKSINKAGKTQTAEVMGMEVHVLDSAHMDSAHVDPEHKGDGWAFYGFENKVNAKVIPHTADCYSCHQQHAAVDTTFVQFYPTLIESAEKHKSLSAGYLKEVGTK